MIRDRILVCGANGTLGQALLRALGPERALSASRQADPPIAGFEHIQLAAGGGLRARELEGCCAVINAAGRTGGSEAMLRIANIDLPVELARTARDAAVPKFVQVGSFSVYGHAETIGLATPEDPRTNYARSKALADQLLLQLEAPGFLIETVRLPFLFSLQQPGLLQPLLAFARSTHILPICKPEPQRAMITYDDAAAILVEAAGDAHSGISLAADTQPFTFSLLGHIAREEAGLRWRTLALPAPMVGMARVLFPGVARRLFQSSTLVAGENRAGDRPMRLEETLRAIIRRIA